MKPSQNSQTASSETALHFSALQFMKPLLEYNHCRNVFTASVSAVLFFVLKEPMTEIMLQYHLKSNKYNIYYHGQDATVIQVQGSQGCPIYEIHNQWVELHVSHSWEPSEVSAQIHVGDCW